MDKMVLYGQIRVDKTKWEQIIITNLVNFSCELEPIMARYDFL